MKMRKKIKDLIQTVYLSSFTVFLEINYYKKKEKKKKKLKTKKKNCENDLLTGHFQSFFILFYFVPSLLNLKKKIP